MFQYKTWLSLFTILISMSCSNAQADSLKKTTKKEFNETFQILKKTEAELREAHNHHLAHAFANNSQVTSENASRWKSFSSTWNQNLKANKELDATRKQYGREGLFDCPGLFNISEPSDQVKCSMDMYQIQLSTLWSLMNRQMSGRVPAYKKDLENVENEIKEAKKKIQVELKKMK